MSLCDAIQSTEMIFSGEKQNDFYFSASFRGVAQPGLEYTSGGRVVAGSNPVTPTKKRITS